MVGIQINENVIITKAVKASNKEAVEITFEEVEEKKPNLFERQMQTQGPTDVTSNSAIVRIWRFKVPTYQRNGQDLTPSEKINIIDQDMTETENKMYHILQRYLPKDQVKLNKYQGLDEINGENYEEAWLDDVQLKAMFENLADQFTEQLAPFVGDRDLKSRLKLVKAKKTDFTEFPGAKFLSKNPFFEPMDIPKKDSLIAFTKYEIDNGLSSVSATPKEGADIPAEATPETARKAWGNR